MTHVCEQCGKEFGYHTNLLRHLRTIHSDAGYEKKCVTCNLNFSREDNSVRHFINKHNVRVGKFKPGMDGMIVCFKVYPTNTPDENAFLTNCRGLVMYHLKRMLNSFVENKEVISLVIWCSMECHLTKINGDEILAHFNCSKHDVYIRTDIVSLLEEKFGHIKQNLTNFQEKGSGWVLKEVKHLDVHVILRCALC